MGSVLTRLLALSTACAALTACREEVPTAIDETLLPDEPLTLEVQLPWSEFGSDLEVFGGYGAPDELGAGVVANDFGGTLHARTLVRFAAYPASASVVDTTGTTRTDFELTFLSGRLVTRFDTIASTNSGPVTLVLGAIQEEWDPGSTNWTFAVDSVGGEVPWPEVGGGPVAAIDTTVWDPAATDSVWFELDSAQVAAWSDATNPARGARLELTTPGERLLIRGAFLRLDTRAASNPDTMLVLSADADAATFIYDPPAQPPTDGIRVGGTPSWRTILDVDLPDGLTGPPELCNSVGCPFTLGPQHISFAGLAMTSRATEMAFQPTDSVRLDVRAVLSRAAMPKSPLGGSLIAEAGGTAVAPEVFGSQVGQVVEVPITAFLRGFLAGADPGGAPPPNTVALLAIAEPSNFAFASFHGPGSPFEPVLNLILTVSQPVELP